MRHPNQWCGLFPLLLVFVNISFQKVFFIFYFSAIVPILVYTSASGRTTPLRTGAPARLNNSTHSTRNTETMRSSRWCVALSVLLCFTCSVAQSRRSAPSSDGQTIALWLFDEPQSLYPSASLDDSSSHDQLMALGLGGRIVGGKFGNALDPVDYPPLQLPNGEARFGLAPAPAETDQSAQPLTWANAKFAALMTSGENHLRKVPFANASDTRLNLGNFDWTVEFWYLPERTSVETATVFELGSGPRGIGREVTRLSLDAAGGRFEFENSAGHCRVQGRSDARALRPASGRWVHLAFVYTESDHRIRHFVNGRLQPASPSCQVAALPHGDAAYFTVARDGAWQHPLPGRIDELRFSEGAVYSANFTPPDSFAPVPPQSTLPQAQPLPLLFPESKDKDSSPVQLGGRKYVFIDGAILDKSDDIAFTVNPPRQEQVVLEYTPNLTKHVSVLEDANGLIRLYYEGPDDTLAVATSKDGLHFTLPDVGHGEYKGQRNIVTTDHAVLGNVFLDPTAPPASHYKMVSGIKGREIYLFTSPDGFTFHRWRTSVLPFWGASQSNVFWDDQQQVFLGYHRSDFHATPGGATQRESVYTRVKDLYTPWPYHQVTQQETWAAAKTVNLRRLQPHFLDNGPLAPGGIGLEFPPVFGPIPQDAPGTDIYVAQAVKYPWAPDTYVAFPAVYFHYEGDGPAARQILGSKEAARGSGVVETEVAVSRDGEHWTRYPRPVYIGLGEHGGRILHMAYMAEGMVRRGNEIWQYYLGDDHYHSWIVRTPTHRAIFRVVQRLDGFVSADAAYTGGMMETRPFIFSGKSLELNVKTEATGSVQVGFEDPGGAPIPGYSVDDCVYLNTDELAAKVAWLKAGSDVSSLAGKPVRLVFRMRGAKLFSFQFVPE